MEVGNTVIPLAVAENVNTLHAVDVQQQNVYNASSSGGLDTRTSKVVERKQQEGVENPTPALNGEENGCNKNRRRHRRGSRRNKPRKPRKKYKPYNKLTWDEKRKLDERDALKAVRRREELVLQKGRPIAPYNTTQFLMEEHDPGDIQNLSPHHHVDSESSSSYSSGEYFEKDFDEFYERVHIDTLNSYSKEDLIKNVYELEQRIENLEKDAKENNVDTLKEENLRLTKENKELKDKADIS